MNEEELIETLKLFEKNKVEQLKEPARNLFYAIMRIADERDELKERNIKLYKKDTKIILDLQDQLQQKENIIKEVREYIHWRLDNRQDMYITQMTELLEILDKGETNER